MIFIDFVVAIFFIDREKINTNNSQLFFLANNAFKPECCTPASPLAYSASTGCACVTKEQIDYINKRGGNRNPCGGGF